MTVKFRGKEFESLGDGWYARPVELPRQDELTPVQRDLLLFILKFTEDHCYQPNYAEMAAYQGVQPKAVHDTLGQLERKGFIRLPPARTERALEIPWARMELVEDAAKIAANSADVALA
jgi:SOS-response transcriptional repressor LexA